MKNLLYISILFLVVISCNKEKRYSTKLMKGETWRVKGVYVDEEYYGWGGTWKITSDVDIYDSIPGALWSANSQTAAFQWQFQDKGKSFMISYKDPSCVNCTTPPDELDFQCYFLSGKYSVEQHKNIAMKFTSIETVGFPGKNVRIEIEKV